MHIADLYQELSDFRHLDVPSALVLRVSWREQRWRERTSSTRSAWQAEISVRNVAVLSRRIFDRPRPGSTGTALISVEFRSFKRAETGKPFYWVPFCRMARRTLLSIFAHGRRLASAFANLRRCSGADA